MKKITFCSAEYTVPEWANYITQDSSGLIEVHESKPKNNYDDSSGISYWVSYDRTEELFFPSAKCEEIK